METLKLEMTEIKEIFLKSIKDEASRIVTTMAKDDAIIQRIRAAFDKRWHFGTGNDEGEWLEQGIREACANVMYRAIQQAVEESGMEEIVKQIAADRINSDEFKVKLTEQINSQLDKSSFHVPSR